MNKKFKIEFRILIFVGVVLSTVYFTKNAPEFHFTDYVSYSIILPLISIYGLWGLLYINNN